MAVNKDQLAREVATELGVTIKDAERFAEAYWGRVNTHIAEGETVSIFNEVKFETVERAERKGRNPQTGEELTIPAHKTVKVTPYSHLKGLAK